jgi:hypothetical protein
MRPDRIAEPEKAIARQRLCKLATIPEPSLSNIYASDNEGTVGSGIFCAVRAEAL